MSLLRRVANPSVGVEERAAFAGTTMAQWASWVGNTPKAGEVVNLESGMRENAFAACRRVLVTEVAQLPLHAYTKHGKGRKRLPTQPQLLTDPSGVVSRRNWLAQIMDSLVRAGNAYLKIVEVSAAGEILQAESIAPGHVSWQPDGGVMYPHIDGERQTMFPAGDFVHIPASAFIQAGSALALSPIEASKEQISLGLAAERYVAEWFGGGGHPSSVIYSERPMANDDEARSIKQAYVAATEGRQPAVFGSGLKVEPIQAAPEKGMIDIFRFVTEQACRATGVPPSMIYAAVSGQSITYANVTESDLQFLKHSLGIWLGDVEDALTRMMSSHLHYAKFNVDGLLRMTPKARAENISQGLANKTLSVNEGRLLEDRTPWPDPIYDEPGLPGGIDLPETGETDDE